MTVSYEIDAATANNIAAQPSAEKHTPINPQGVKPGKSPFSPMMHGCVLD
jgi:hypothetical protein